MTAAELVSVVLSAGAFIAVIWQIARAEGMQPTSGCLMQREVLEENDSHTDVRVLVAPQGPATLHSVELVVWEGVFVGTPPVMRLKMDAGSKPLEAIVRAPRGTDTKVGITWLMSSRIRHRPVRGVSRRLLLGGPETWEQWSWSWFSDPRPSASYGRGRWKKLDRQWGRNRKDLPERDIPRAGQAPG